MLRESGFELLTLPDEGIYRSESFPGLWLNAEAMLQQDGKLVMETLNDGLESPDHTDFVQRLEGRRRGDSK